MSEVAQTTGEVAQNRAMSEVAQTLGQRLRRERERKGLSLQKAADLLHLDAWVIDALENDDYTRIGPSVYGKGHLKHYANLLGLPAAEILETYENRTVPAPSIQTSTVRTPIPDTGSGSIPWAAIAVVAAALIAAAALWRKPWQPSPPRTNTSAAVESARPGGVNEAPTVADRVDGESAPGAPTAGALANVDGAAVPARVAVPASAAVAAVPTGEAGSTAGAGRARLRLSFSSDSWVDVQDASGRRVFTGYGRANSVKSVAGAAPLKVYLGFASGVQLEINNHVVAIGPQFVAGDAAHFEAGADGVLRVVAHVSTASNPHPRG